MVREASIEGYLRARVKDSGGLCVKLNPAGYAGIPDRLVVLPGGWIAFVEVKKPQGGAVGKAQFVWRGMLMALGARHAFAFTRDDVDEILEAWRHEHGRTND
jgi:hypothetical protein